jgi:hypothetical protein
VAIKVHGAAAAVNLPSSEQLQRSSALAGKEAMSLAELLLVMAAVRAGTQPLVLPAAVLVVTLVPAVITIKLVILAVVVLVAAEIIVLPTDTPLVVE